MATLTNSVRAKNSQTNIDLTPMLDVVFILLIFFVVTASFLKETTLSLDSQETTEQPDGPVSDNILIQLAADNSVIFNGERIDISAVRARVTQHRAEVPEAAVIINVHPSSIASTLVSIVNSSKEAGVNSILVQD